MTSLAVSSSSQWHNLLRRVTPIAICSQVTPLRLPFFLLLSVAAIGIVLDPIAAQTPQQSGKREYWPFERVTNDLFLWENIPNFSGEYKGAPIKTNQWGMRDKDYTLTAPRGTYRIALVGSSVTMGPGVPADLTMEALLEDRLNREGPGAPQRHFEILNFSAIAYGLMQNVAVVDRKVFPFTPDAVLVGIFTLDAGRVGQYLIMLLRSKIPIPYPYVQQKMDEAGVTAAMEEPELRRRLGPVTEHLMRWAYQHIVEVCRQRGVPVLGLVLPDPRPSGRTSLPSLDLAARLAASAGMPLLDLRGVYEGQNLALLRLSLERGDSHWSVLGHKLISDRIYELLRANDKQGLKLGFEK